MFLFFKINIFGLVLICVLFLNFNLDVFGFINDLFLWIWDCLCFGGSEDVLFCCLFLIVIMVGFVCVDDKYFMLILLILFKLKWCWWGILGIDNVYIYFKSLFNML